MDTYVLCKIVNAFPQPLALMDDRRSKRSEYDLCELGVWDVELRGNDCRRKRLFPGSRDLVDRLIVGSKMINCLSFGIAACFANILCLCLRAFLIFVASLNLSATRSLGLTSSTGERKCNEVVQPKTHPSSGKCCLAFHSLRGTTNRCELRHMGRVTRIRRFGLSSPFARACCSAATSFMR